MATNNEHNEGIGGGNERPNPSIIPYVEEEESRNNNDNINIAKTTNDHVDAVTPGAVAVVPSNTSTKESVNVKRRGLAWSNKTAKDQNSNSTPITGFRGIGGNTAPNSGDNKKNKNNNGPPTADTEEVTQAVQSTHDDYHESRPLEEAGARDNPGTANAASLDPAMADVFLGPTPGDIDDPTNDGDARDVESQQTGEATNPIEATLVPDEPQAPPPGLTEPDNNSPSIPEAEMLPAKSLRAQWLGISPKGKLQVLLILAVLLGLTATGVVCGATDVCGTNAGGGDRSANAQPSLDFLGLPNHTTAALANASSLQSRALDWILNEYGYDQLRAMPRWRGQQIFAVLCFYFALDGLVTKEAFRSTFAPNSSRSECQWDYTHLVTACDPTTGRITYLRLETFDDELVGRIPSEVELLPSLETLWMEGLTWIAHLPDAFPTQILSLPNLTYISLEKNALQGSLPTTLYQLTELTQLDLHTNGFEGTISSQLGLLTNLEFLNLKVNSFQGQVPTELGLLTQLTYLELENTKLTGTLPSQIAKLTLLEDLNWQRIPGTGGAIPTQLGLMTWLTNLALSRCGFSGTIPSQLGGLTRLEGLRLHANQNLGGTVPAGVCALSRNGTHLRVNDCTGNPEGNNANIEDGNDFVNANGLVFCPADCDCTCGR